MRDAPNIYLNWLDLRILVAALEQWQKKETIKPVGLMRKLERVLEKEARKGMGLWEP